MRFLVHWYGPLRDGRAADREPVDSQAATPEALWSDLAQRHGLPGRAQLALAVAVGDDLVAWDAPLADGDEIAFLPPVAGG
jgi:molybdopterin synthase sulfur carrier subunit